MRVTLFHNPTAGHDRPSGQDLVAAVKQIGHEPVYCSMKHREAIERTLEVPADLVVAAGGDGTVRKIATRVIGRGVPITILPIGTANNIARSLGISGGLTHLIAGWSAADRVAFDAGRVRGRWGDRRFLEATGLGLVAHMIAAVSQVDTAPADFYGPEDELDRDLRALRGMLAQYWAHDVRAMLDGEDLSGRYLLVEAMNIRSIGPNVELAPDADFSDGLLDVVLLADADRDTFDDYLARRLEGREARLDLPVRQGRRLEVAWQGLPVHVDDEILPAGEEPAPHPVPADSSLDITLERQGIEFLVPR